MERSKDINVQLLTTGRHAARIELSLPKSCTLSEFRARAVRSEPALQEIVLRGGSLRLIFGGRILSSLHEQQTLESLHINDGSVVHGLLTEARQQAQQQPQQQPPQLSGSSQASDTRINMGMGPATASGGLAGSTSSSTPSAPPSAEASLSLQQQQQLQQDQQQFLANLTAAQSTRGFDRLVVLGLSEEEITNLRQVYLPEVQATVRTPLQPGEDEMGRLRRMEEIWMHRQDESSEFVTNLRPLLRRAAETLGYRVGADGRIIGRRDGTVIVPEGSAAAASRRSRGHGEGGAWSSDEEGSGNEGNGTGATRGTGSLTNDGGTAFSLLLGFAAGFFLGGIMLIWLISPSVSKLFKLGVIIGVLGNFVAGQLLGDALNGAGNNSDSKSGSGEGGGGGGGGLGPTTSMTPINF